MQISVTFKNIKSSSSLKDYIEEKLNRLDKLLYKPGSAEVVFRTEKERKIVEINFTGDKMDIHASTQQEEMQAAIDAAVDKVKRQIIRNKEKRQDRRYRDKEAEAEMASETEVHAP